MANHITHLFYTLQEIKVGVSDLPIDKDTAVSMEPYPVVENGKCKYKGTDLPP